ncbi:metal ABC transporter permease [Dissulfurirhabdus thermomarina]|uniref:Metal ABC transporter permease n=1 Tax=Dissulfurirhabdus thermomarina TaxID=1765737 RepID=A0A6N9TP40_DISTH|nr:metal ABC transporter permease [Dissulfurirhabdus thermomarina]NDY43025.1 metal ABC transporter permease [Dissulfurirhabdus thermomarina]NMX22916.1 metal ABC transporter permease [Dissulfurirhabdus thermomarina]
MTMEWLQVFTYGFMQRALAAGLLVGGSCAVLGVFLVLRREAMVGHGLAHVTFGGVALALFTGTAPLPVALAVALAAAWAMVRLKDRAGLGGDTGIGILASLGMAAGVILASLAGDFNAELLSYLFGSILAIDPGEVWIAGGLAAAVIAAVALCYHELIYDTFDRETARAAGLAVGRLDGLVVGLAAVTVVIGMRVVGLLLVAALLVVPAAAGLVSARSFRGAVLRSVAAALVSVAGGLVAAVAFDWPASGAIVAISGGLLLAALAAGRRG